MRRWTIIMFFAFFLGVESAEANKQIVVDLSKQKAYAYEDGRLLFSGWISTGRPGRRTPPGRYRVLEKERYHVSSKYPPPHGGAQMNYMLRLTDYGIAMHLGYVPNYPASHGCIRMENGFAQKMYAWARVGTPVIVKGSPPHRIDRSFARTRNALLLDESEENSYAGRDPLKFLSVRPHKGKAKKKKKTMAEVKKRRIKKEKRREEMSKNQEEARTPLGMLRG